MGSEMCIRDRCWDLSTSSATSEFAWAFRRDCGRAAADQVAVRIGQVRAATDQVAVRSGHIPGRGPEDFFGLHQLSKSRRWYLLATATPSSACFLRVL